MHRLSMLVVTGMLAFSSAAYAGDHRGEHREDHDRKEVYGVLKELPKERFGIWTVGTRKVRVDEGTYINEKHGIVKIGCRLEVRGSEHDGIIDASEVEVKR